MTANYPASANRGARFSMLARTASVWLGAAEQLLLLDRFREQRRSRIDGQVVQHALGGADRVRSLARDFAGDLEGRSKRVVADPGRKAIAHGFLAGEDAPGIGEVTQNIVAD